MKWTALDKKYRLWVVIALTAVILIAAVMIIFNRLDDSKKPEQMLKQYYSYIEKENYKKMYALILKNDDTSITKKAFIKRNKNIYKGIDASDIKVKILGSVKKGWGNYYLTYQVTMNTCAGKTQFNTSTTISRSLTEDYYIHWTDAMIYPTLTSEDKVKVSVFKPKRGDIIDRNGKVLAGEGLASSVGVIPNKLGENKEENMKKLAELLGVDVRTIEKNLSASWVKDDSFVPIKTIEKASDSAQYFGQVDARANRIKQLESNLLAIPGVMITDTKIRKYSLGEKAAHLIGYVGAVTAEDLKKDKTHVYDSTSQIGRTGLESLYEKRLRGTKGGKISIMDETGHEKDVITYQMEKDGEDIKLTIDAQLMELIYDQYKKDKSASVAINPKTGEVLALVSTPSYDNNQFIYGLGQGEWKSLNENADKPMYNRFRATFSPGSSMKPITAAIGLSTGKLSATESFGESVLSWQKNQSWGNYKVTTLHTYGAAVMKNALIYSDNIYFAKAALKIGSETFLKELEKIGFTKKMPFPIHMTTSTVSTDGKFSTEIQLADSGYGQGQVLFNPLHMASVYSAFVNEGSMIKPYLEGKKKPKDSYWIENAFTKEAAETVSDALLAVIEDPNGTGRSAKIPGHLLAGKTGTAEIKANQEDTKGTELGWFAVYTMNDQTQDPLLLITMTEDVKGRRGSGYVTERTKNILSDYWN